MIKKINLLNHKAQHSKVFLAFSSFHDLVNSLTLLDIFHSMLFAVANILKSAIFKIYYFLADTDTQIHLDIPVNLILKSKKHRKIKGYANAT